MINDSIKEGKEFRIHPYLIEVPSGEESEYQLYLREIQNLFATKFCIGDKVFAVKLKYGDNEYTVDAYCRPGENKIIFDDARFFEMKDLYKR